MSALEGRASRKIADRELGLLSGDQSLAIRAMVLAAHPDDETIGASAVLGRMPNSSVVYLTDGAPRDPALRATGHKQTRAEYAYVRKAEAQTALSVLGIPVGNIHFLKGTDQDAIRVLSELIKELSSSIVQQHPDILITHPYEGAHPDHDSAALAAALAIKSLRREDRAVPELLEMTSYHERDGKLVVGEFLPENSIQPPNTDELVIRLSSEDVARKKRMMKAHLSQKSVLADFSPELPERLRIAPKYDFSKPPHPGKLRYESMGWKITGEQWRNLALDAIEKFSSRSASVSREIQEANAWR